MTISQIVQFAWHFPNFYVHLREQQTLAGYSIIMSRVFQHLRQHNRSVAPHPRPAWPPLLSIRGLTSLTYVAWSTTVCQAAMVICLCTKIVNANDSDFMDASRQTNNVDAWQRFVPKVANFQLLHLYSTYPTCIWRLHWGWPCLSFVEIFGTRKLESLSYRVALITWSCV